MANIIKEILKKLPDGKISDSVFEGANIVLYTKDRDYFLNNEGTIRDAVNEFKKRIELRPDPSITLKEEETEIIIKKSMPEDAGLGNIIFDKHRSQVIIEVDKPGIAIGKQGEILRTIKKETMWVPNVRRRPAIKCDLIDGIRSVLYENNTFRRKFLNDVGERVYAGWTKGRKEEWVRLTYLGSGRQVGRSCILLQTPESKILLDCGVDVSAADQHAYPYFDCPEFKIDELDAVIVSHAHLDHSAIVPLLFKYGYKGPIYCTDPTRDMMSLLQLDLVKIMRMEGKEPLYTSEEVKEMVKHTIILNFEEVTDITPDIRITFYNAGHIIGSAMVHIHIGNGLHNLLYSADIKYMKSRLLAPAVTKFPRLESMMLESTYGGKDCLMPSREQTEDELAQIIVNTIQRGGKVLVPVLGSGRAQEIMLIIESLVREEKMPKVPVWVDGMVWDITAIHTAYPEYMNSDVRKRIFHKDQNPFLAPYFNKVGSQKERKKITDDDGPCVILATSGMMAGGPSVAYFKELAEGEKHTIIFVSYLGPGSLGRRVASGEKEIGLDSGGRRRNVLKVKMEVHQMDGFSGHAGRQELMDFVNNCSPRPRKIILNHGEVSRALDLASSLHKKYRLETICPKNLEAIRLR
jgi:uncharacterized protein